MPVREEQMSGRAAPGRGLPRVLLAAALCATTLAVESKAAAAFEIFGIKLWGSSKNEDADIVDPLRYSTSITSSDADKDLIKKLENASALKGDEDHPVSGSLGLLAKARSDREQLVAALYADARYEGIVNISIAGKSLDELPPDAEFKGPQPIPVEINVTAGPRFTLGNIHLKGDAAGLMSADYGLIAGGDAGSGAVLRAEALIVRTLKEQGRPLAKVTDREIVADLPPVTDGHVSPLEGPGLGLSLRPEVFQRPDATVRVSRL